MSLFNRLGCRQAYRGEGARWAMVEQPGVNIDIQLIETEQSPQTTEYKRNSHIAFLSNDPQRDISELETYIKLQDKKVVVGRWSDRELYIDCPDIFIDFVIEIMHESVITDPTPCCK